MKKWPQPKPHPKTDRGNRRFDTSQLKPGGTQATSINRDYFAHVARWSFATTFIHHGMRTLEIGCGQTQPLIQVLRGQNVAHVPKLHVAVDLNPIKKPSGIGWTRTHEKFNFVDDWKELWRLYGSHSFDVITCFEVIEHMEKRDGRKLLNGADELLKKNGRFLLSTPVYNGIHMAAAHIHEYQFDELKEEVEELFKVENVYGTFINYNKLKKVASKAELELVNELREFLPLEVLANFLAPKYPRAASNCCWVLTTK